MFETKEQKETGQVFVFFQDTLLLLKFGPEIIQPYFAFRILNALQGNEHFPKKLFIYLRVLAVFVLRCFLL